MTKEEIFFEKQPTNQPTKQSPIMFLGAPGEEREV